MLLVGSQAKTYVELSTRVAASTVQSNHLYTQEVLARSNTLWDLERHLALVLDHLVNGPLLGGWVVAVVVDLEPLQAADVGLSRAVDLGTADRCQ